MRDAPRSIFGRTVDELSDEKLARPDIPAPPIEHGRGERLRFRLKAGDLVAVSNFDLLVGALRRLVSPRTAEAIVEVDRAELRPGDRLRVLVIQRAPAELESFTVSLCANDPFSAWSRSARSGSTTTIADIRR